MFGRSCDAVTQTYKKDLQIVCYVTQVNIQRDDFDDIMDKPDDN